jgi:tetratricopeptide (TPR) repeat protein
VPWPLTRTMRRPGALWARCWSNSPRPNRRGRHLNGRWKADQKFAPAWAQLARLAADDGRMQDSLYAAECALQLDPTGFPEVYVSQATADLALDRLDAAEKSARRAIELDSFHEIPRAERVLGSVLAAKGDHEGAIQHWKKYLDLSPKAEDAPEVRRRIAGLDASATEKK